jgi:hypothetical protein
MLFCGSTTENNLTSKEKAMKIEISSEAFNALVKEYEKYMDLYDEIPMTADDYEAQHAFVSLFETVGMVIAEVVNEGLDDWCEQNRSVMEAALRESQPLKEIV